MAQTNKLLLKYLAVNYIFASVFLGILTFTSGMDIYNKLNTKSINTTNQDNFHYVLNALLAVICLSIVYLYMVHIPNNTRKKAYELTQRYLDYISIKYPESAHLKELAKNKENMKQLCAFICNSLTKEDKDKILTLINNYNLTQNKSSVEDKVLLQKLEEEILDVVKQRTLVDKNFVNNIIKNGIPVMMSREGPQR